MKRVKHTVNSRRMGLGLEWSDKSADRWYICSSEIKHLCNMSGFSYTNMAILDICVLLLAAFEFFIILV